MGSLLKDTPFWVQDLLGKRVSRFPVPRTPTSGSTTCSQLPEVICMGTIRAEAKLCDGHMGDMKSRPGTIDAMCSVLQEMRTWQARGMECVRPMCTDFLEAQASAHPHPTSSHPPSGHFL